MFIKLLESADPMQIILKLPGDDCNMNCAYCYEKRRSYDSSGHLCPSTLDAFLRWLGPRSLSVQLHGGEPLMIGTGLMEDTIAVLKRYGGAITLNIQTNGTLLDDRWLDLFERSWGRVELGISLDGDADADSYRVGPDARSRHETVVRAIRRCCERKCDIGIISVVNRRVIDRAPQVLQFFAQFPAVKMINFSPCMDFDEEPAGAGKEVRSAASGPRGGRTARVPEWAITPEEYRIFIEDVFAYWRDNDLFKRFLIEPIFSIMRTVHGRPARLCHFNGMKCFHILTLYPDGHVGRCDELGVHDDTVALVDVGTGSVVESDPHGEEDFLEKVHRLNMKCEACSYREVCRGGCVAARLRYQGTEYDYEYCAQRAALIDCIASGIGAPPILKQVPVIGPFE